MNHPYATLPNIFTYMWCLWKSRNDFLFQRKNGEPYQIFINAQALLNNLEVHNPISHNTQGSNQKHIQIPMDNSATLVQGTTMTPDKILHGVLVFTDASWKSRNISVLDDREMTGIGIHIQDESVDRKWNIMIQASTKQEQSTFQAEARALLLAAKITQILHISTPTFLTDNQVLAKTAAGRKLDHSLLHWSARSHLADYIQATTNSSPQVFHISREINKVAHNCATQVLRRSLNQPIFRCSSSAHSRDDCPILSILQHVHLQDFVILAAWCS